MSSTCEAETRSARALAPYPVYKDSGVESLGKVPEHWEVGRVKRVCRLVYGDALASGERDGGSIPVFGSNGPVGCHAVANTGGPCVVVGRKGSFGKVNFSPVPVFAIDTTFFIDYRVSSADIRWLFFILGWLQLDQVTKDSAVPGLDREDVYRRLVAIPPLAEQASIVRFLEHADRRIRRYIRAKKRLIELLEEQKQAIIREAVTGQIDVRTGQPYPAYKDSRVEWLGKVPEHWEVSALRFRYEQCLGKMLDSKRIVGEHLVPYLRNVDVQWDEINSSNLPRMDIYPREIARYTLRPGDLLVCEGGEIGRCAIWQGEIKPCGFQKALHRLRPRKNDRDRPRFLSYALRVAVSRGAFHDGHESTIGHLTGEKLRSHRFAFPPAEEQRSVETFLQNIQRRIGALQNSRMKSIDLFKEYRTRLIADVVTGKLDVREAVAGLPDAHPVGSGTESIRSEANSNGTEHVIGKEALQ